MVVTYHKESVMDQKPDRPISRLRRDHHRRPLWLWVLGLVAVVAVMILLPRLLDRLE
ncbi:MAG: hypothetical protein GY838_07585 [bacterium]|nr:hypothetical protein [bacterium]